MYYLINVDHNGMTVQLTRSECEGFMKCCMGETDNMLLNGIEKDGMLV
jgi:hypothetical protein